MARLEALGDVFRPGLELGGVPTPDGPKDYLVPLPSMELGLWCQMIANATGQIHRASETAEIQRAVELMEQLPELGGADISLAQRVLGAVYDEMKADGVKHPYVEFCGMVAYIWIIAGEDAAAAYWHSGGHPEAPGPVPNRADRRRSQREERSSRTISTDGDGTTQPRGSGNGTRSPRRRRNRGRPGGKSSTSGP